MIFVCQRMQAAVSSSDAYSVLLRLEPVCAVLIVTFAPDQQSPHAAYLSDSEEQGLDWMRFHDRSWHPARLPAHVHPCSFS